MWRNYHPPTFTQTPDWDWTPDMSEWQRTFPWEPLCSLGWFGLDHAQRDLFGNTASKTTIQQYFVSYQMELPWMRMSQTLSRLPSWNQNLPKCNSAHKKKIQNLPSYSTARVSPTSTVLSQYSGSTGSSIDRRRPDSYLECSLGWCHEVGWKWSDGSSIVDSYLETLGWKRRKHVGWGRVEAGAYL